MIHQRLLGIVSVCEVAFLCVPEMGTNKIGEVACLEIKYFAHDHCSVAARAELGQMSSLQPKRMARQRPHRPRCRKRQPSMRICACCVCSHVQSLYGTGARDSAVTFPIFPRDLLACSSYPSPSATPPSVSLTPSSLL